MFWNRLEERNINTQNNYNWTEFKEWLMNNNGECLELQESTYLKCIKYISESVAKCPIVLQQKTEDGICEATKHKLYDKLRNRMNAYMSSVNCIKTFVALGEHYGISGLFIDRNTMDLYPVQVTGITIDNAGLIYSNKKNAILYNVNLGNNNLFVIEEDLVVYRSGISLDGINVKANKDLMKETIKTNIKSQRYLGELFDNGLTNKILVQMTSDIKDEKELKKIQSKFDRLYSSNGRTFTVPVGFNVSALNLSLADAQFEQIRKLSRREIANVFGLSPAQIGDLSDSNNNNMEMQNLSFLTDTLLIKFQQIEQELDYKYLTIQDRQNGFRCRFNQGVLLRTNAETQADILTRYVQQGILLRNEAREQLGYCKIDGGEKLFLPSGTLTINSIKGGDNGEGKGD